MSFQNLYEFSQFFFTFFKIPLLKKNWNYNRETIRQSPRKFLCVIWNLDTKINISKIRNVTFIFQNFQKQKKLKKFQWILKKPINSFEIKKKDKSPDYLWDNFFRLFFNNFWELLLCKILYMFLTSLIWFILPKFLLYRKVLKFWSY